MSVLKKSFFSLCSWFLFVSLAGAQESKPASWLMQADELQWGYLNPLRGDKSPAAAELWGDRTKNVPVGMLVKFRKGFSSPPHIHNITYRGVVIEGLLHNDDPGAALLWMPTASFWTQPAGENHITAANGDSNLIYLEIDSGPYLVKPTSQAFDNGEKPLNLHADNIVWQNLEVSGQQKQVKAQIAYLWGEPGNGLPYGSLIRLNSGTGGQIISRASEFRAVLISGVLQYKSVETGSLKSLIPGSYFGSTGEFAHHIQVSQDSILYIRSDDEYNIVLNDGL